MTVSWLITIILSGHGCSASAGLEPMASVIRLLIASFYVAPFLVPVLINCYLIFNWLFSVVPVVSDMSIKCCLR